LLSRLWELGLGGRIAGIGDITRVEGLDSFF